MLDAMRVAFDCTASTCTQRITAPQGATLVSWNGDIATTGITLNWSGSGAAAGGGGSGTETIGAGSCKAPVAGNWSLVVETVVSGAGAAVPAICIDGLAERPTSQGAFCNAASVRDQLPAGAQIVSCSFSGNSGTIAARISSPITIDYSVTYTYVQR